MPNSATSLTVTLFLAALVGLAVGVFIGRRGTRRPSPKPEEAPRRILAATTEWMRLFSACC